MMVICCLIFFFQRIIGILLYLIITQPDLSYSVHRLSQHMAQPQFPHLHVVFQILQYLKTFSGLGLLFLATNFISFKVFAYSNQDLLIVVGLLLDIVCILVILQSHGRSRNNLLFPDPQQMLSITQWLQQLVNQFGFSLYFLILVFSIITVLNYFVTTKLPYTQLLTLF